MSESQQPKSQQKKLVIIGGGFAGVKLASKLERGLPQDWDIYLLSKTNFITYNPLLPEVIGASILPGHVQAPFRLILKRTRIRMVTVDNIDHASKTIYYHNDQHETLSYDQLVFAAGVQANTNMLPGLDEHTLPLKTVGDALYIRNQVIERLEQATIHPDPIRRKALTTFVVLGGGFSGVETAGELADFLQSAQRYYKNVKYEDCRVVIVHSGDRLLPEVSEKLSAKVLKSFKKRGIEVLLNERAMSVEHERITFKSNEIINGTTPDMSVEGHDGIWAMGDCALVPNQLSGEMCPPTAQFADRQATVLAHNIIAKLANKETQTFSYKPVGMLASIGHNNAVAQVFGFQFSGLIGFMMWRGIYLMKVPTLARKVRLFLEWNWAMFFPPDIAHLGFKRSKDDKVI